MVAVTGAHRAQQGDVLGLLGDGGKVFADLYSGSGGIDVLVAVAFFHVPGVRLGRAARHPQEDAGLGLVALRLRGGGAASEDVEPERLGSAQSASRGELEEVSAINVVTKHSELSFKE